MDPQPEGLFNAKGDELEQIKAQFDAGVKQVMDANPIARFTIAYRMFPFGISSFSEVLLALRDYNLAGVVEKITTPVLISAPEGESFWPGQSEELYKQVPSEKTLAAFTTADGADLHCEPKAMGLRSEVFFDWLDGVIGKA